MLDHAPTEEDRRARAQETKPQRMLVGQYLFRNSNPDAGTYLSADIFEAL